MDFVSLVAGAAGVLVVYLIYLSATKGLPAAWAWLKAKWNAGKAQAIALQSDIDAAHVRITALEQQVAQMAAQLLPKPAAAPSTTAAASLAAVAAAIAPAPAAPQPAAPAPAPAPTQPTA